MKIKKKIYIIWIINLMAFGSLMTTVYFRCGLSTFIYVLLPSSIIFGTTMSVALGFYYKK